MLRHFLGRIASDSDPILPDLVDEFSPQPLKLIYGQGRSTLVGSGAVHIVIVAIDRRSAMGRKLTPPHASAPSDAAARPRPRAALSGKSS